MILLFLQNFILDIHFDLNKLSFLNNTEKEKAGP